MNVMHLIILVIMGSIFLSYYFKLADRITQRRPKTCSPPARETLAKRLRILCELTALRTYFEERVLGLEAEIAHLERSAVELDYPDDLKEFALRRIANRELEKEEILSTLSDLPARIKYMADLVNASRVAVEEEAQATRRFQDRRRVADVCLSMG